jgi:hypothetical protein
MLGYKQPVSLLAVAGLWATSAVAQLIPMNYCASINTATTNGSKSTYPTIPEAASDILAPKTIAYTSPMASAAISANPHMP